MTAAAPKRRAAPRPVRAAHSPHHSPHDDRATARRWRARAPGAAEDEPNDDAGYALVPVLMEVLVEGAPYTYTQRLVAVVIADHIGKNPDGYPALDTIAKRCNLGLSTVKEAIRALCTGPAAVFKCVSGRPVRGRKPEANRYSLVPRLAAMASSRLYRSGTKGPATGRGMASSRTTIGQQPATNISSNVPGNSSSRAGATIVSGDDGCAPADRAYVARVLRVYTSVPCTRDRPTRSDELEAEELFREGKTAEHVEAGILLASARVSGRTRVGSLRYFREAIEEASSGGADAGYVAYLRARMEAAKDGERRA